MFTALLWCGTIWWMKVATALSSFKNERMFVSMRQSVA